MIFKNFKCDYSDKCKRLPYVEVYYKNEKGESVWSYLCRWHWFLEHYIRRKKHGYTKVDKNYRKIAKSISDWVESRYKIYVDNTNEFEVKTTKTKEDFLDDLHEYISFDFFNKNGN